MASSLYRFLVEVGQQGTRRKGQNESQESRSKLRRAERVMRGCGNILQTDVHKDTEKIRIASFGALKCVLRSSFRHGFDCE
jgi:hypothetical protein